MAAISALPASGTVMPNPVTLPEGDESYRPALEDGYIDGTARDPLPQPAEDAAGVEPRALLDPQGRLTLAPMPYDNRPRRSNLPMLDTARQLVRAWIGSEHAEFSPKVAQPTERSPEPATAGRRNTFRAQPQPWDAPLYVTPRLDADTDGEVRR